MTGKKALSKLCMACDDELLYEQSGIIFPNELYTIIEKDLDRLEILEKMLDILRHNTNISKNGDGFTISIWLNTENCDMPSCSNLEELLKVLKILKEKNVLKDTYSKEVIENE